MTDSPVGDPLTHSPKVTPDRPVMLCAELIFDSESHRQSILTSILQPLHAINSTDLHFHTIRP